MMTVFMNASPMLSELTDGSSAIAMWTIRRSYGLSGPISCGPDIFALPAMKSAIWRSSLSLSRRKPLQSITMRLSSPSCLRNAVATMCCSACSPSPPRRMNTPPSSPSRLMRVASGVSSTVAVNVTPIELTTSCTNVAIWPVRVSFTLVRLAVAGRPSRGRPRAACALAGWPRASPGSTPSLGSGTAAGARILQPPFRRWPNGSKCGRPDQPVREVLLTDRPEVAHEPVEDDAARRKRHHGREHHRHDHHDPLLRRIRRRRRDLLLPEHGDAHQRGNHEVGIGA